MLHAARKHAYDLWVPGANTQVGLLRLMSPSLAKRSKCTTAVVTSKDSGFLEASPAKPKPAFFPVGQRDKGTLLRMIRAHILPGTRVMPDIYGKLTTINLPKSEPQTFVNRNTGAHTPAHCKYMMGSQTKYAYRNGCGSSTMEMIHLDIL